MVSPSRQTIKSNLQTDAASNIATLFITCKTVRKYLKKILYAHLFHLLFYTVQYRFNLFNNVATQTISCTAIQSFNLLIYLAKAITL